MRKILIISILVLIFLSSVFIFFKEKIPTPVSPPPVSIPSTPEKFPSEAAFKYHTGYGDIFPAFGKEIIVDPGKVKEGETQTISIWVKDEKGVNDVSLKIWTEKEEKEIKFSLVQGDNKEGRWQGSWQAKDILPEKQYKILFRAKNIEGKENTLYFFIETEK